MNCVDASTERDDASRRGEDECKARHRTGHGDCIVNDELNNSVYVYNTDSFPLINNSHNGDPHLPGTIDVTDGQADAAKHNRSVDYQYEPVSSTDGLLRDMSSDILGQDIENIPVITPAQDSPPDLDQVSMVTWGTAFEDPQMMDDDVSPQDNNNATPEVPPTTSETQQPYNQVATARQTPSLAPSSEMTSQQSHDDETYAEAALSDDTACELMCSHRAAHRTEDSSCILTSQSPPKDIASESTADRSLLVYQTTPVPTKRHLRPPPPWRPHQHQLQSQIRLPRPPPHLGNYKTLPHASCSTGPRRNLRQLPPARQACQTKQRENAERPRLTTKQVDEPLMVRR